MAPHIKNPRAKLERDRDKALKVFKQLAPVEYEQFCAAEAGLKALGTPSELIYADLLKDDAAAVDQCLEDHNAWMTPREVANALHRGGYRMDPVRGIGYLVQNITGKLRSRNKLQIVDGKVGRLEWKYPETG